MSSLYGLKISTTTETIIKPAEKQNVNTDTAAIKPQICCPEIQNVIIDTLQSATPKDVRVKSQETQNLKVWFVAQPATEQCSLKTVMLT